MAAAHERRRSVNAAKFAASLAKARAKAVFIAHRHHARAALGLRSIRELLRLFPGWTFGTRPPDEVLAAVRGMPVKEPWSRGARLRSSTRTRPYDDGSYVLLTEEQRETMRRVKVRGLTRRSGLP